MRDRKALMILTLLTVFVFLLVSCSKKPKPDQFPDAKTVTVDGMQTAKGSNPPQPENQPPGKKPQAPPAAQPPKADTRVASPSPRPSYSPSSPLYQVGLKKKVLILDFENKTTYAEERIGEVAARKLSDKLEATQRIIVTDRDVVSDLLSKQGLTFENLKDPSAMKRIHQSLGIQAITFGSVTDVSLMSSKASDTSDEEVSFATAKVEVRLVDASTTNLLRTFIGRSPIFGTRESGEYHRSKAVIKAIEFSLDEILESFLRNIDLLDWETTIARIDGETLYINAGRLTGVRVGDTLQVFEPGKEIINPQTKVSLGWTTGQLKGAIRVTDLFGVDASAGKVLQGQGFDMNDVVKSFVR